MTCDETDKLDDFSPVVTGLYGDTLGAGAVVGSYVIEERASRGGFATVYRGRHARSGDSAAIKVLHRELAVSRRMVERFEQEARAISRIDHPKIVKILQLGELMDGRPFIVMEWLGSRTLASELQQRGPFTMREALAALSDVASALTAAHARGVVHRDVKAQNVMSVPRDDGWFDLKLLDFGIAKLMAPEDAHTKMTTRTMLGTPHNMAPEQIQHEEVDERTDIYALGILLCQLLTLRMPFEGKSVVDVEKQHLEARPPRLSEYAAVPRAIDAVFSRALAKQKQDRYASVSSFIHDLTRSARHDPLDAGAQQQRVARHSCHGVALYMVIGDACDDETIDEAFDLACEASAEAQLKIVTETSNALLAIGTESDSEERRRALIRVAVDLAAAVEARGLTQTRIVVHADDVELDATGEPCGGRLVTVATWPRPRRQRGVFVSRPGLVGLEGEFSPLITDMSSG